jgi:ribonuclease HI
LHGRELLKEGVVWRIGNGETIDVWEHNWIPRQYVQRPLGCKPGVNVKLVKELLDPDRNSWDLEKLNECFFEADVADIVKIPVGRAGSDDYIAWNYTKNGVFSVRSAYHLKQRIKREAGSGAGTSMDTSEHHGWLKLWDADVASKIKVHCWRLAKNGLAVGAELERRKIKENIRCVVCNREETLVHRFWQCPHSARVWDMLRSNSALNLANPPTDLRSHRALQHWLLNWFGNLKEDELALAMTAIYHLWLARNNARDDPMIEDPSGVASRVLALVDEWRSMKRTNAAKEARAVTRWRPPPAGWHKSNADGAYSATEGCGGGGVIIRDHHGEPVAAACCFFPVATDPERAELLACRRAVSLAKDGGVRKLILETDCLGAVAKLSSKEIDRSIHGPVVEDIKKMLGEFEASSIMHVRRSGNEIAHRLAKEGCSNKVMDAWVGSLPEYVMNLLVLDAVV